MSNHRKRIVIGWALRVSFGVELSNTVDEGPDNEYIEGVGFR